MEATRKTRILVVEDDKLFGWTLNHFLQKEGYEVCSATTAESAIDIAQQQPFDIVISDFHLPGLNGKELIQKIKVYQPEMKTVLISAYQKEEMGSEDGPLTNGYLNKPIELGVLKELLQGLTKLKPLSGMAP
jgi:DNA-binding NtrC family response regulator